MKPLPFLIAVVLLTTLAQVFAVSQDVAIIGGNGGGSACSDNNFGVIYDYSPRKWVTNITLVNISAGGGQHRYSELYSYDDVGNLRQLIETETNPNILKRTNFSYDGLNRLISAFVPSGTWTDFNTKAGVYLDTLSWTYDLAGNMKKNNELLYCYQKKGGTHNDLWCGSELDANQIENNRLRRVIIKPGSSDMGTSTDYDYDEYGNLIQQLTWQEISVGTVENIGPNKLGVIGVDDARVGDQVRIMFYHDSNPIYSGLPEGNNPEYAAWTTTVEKYNGSKSPFWDGFPKYQNVAGITSDNKIAGFYSLAKANEFYNDNTYRGQPLIQQYFHAYKQRTTCYFWNGLNQMTQWVDTDGSCMQFTYDPAGMRIKKTERDGPSSRSELSFDGSLQRVDVADSNALDLTTTMTIEAWVNIDSVSAGCDGIVSKGIAGSSAAYQLVACPSPNPGYFRLKFNFTGQNWAGYQIISDDVPLSTWTHVAAVVHQIAGSRYGMWLYCNGAFCTNYVPVQDYPRTSIDPLTIGAISNTRGNAGNGHLHGKVDDVQIWNIDNNIPGTWNLEPMGNEAGLVGYWKFNDLTGSIAKDSSASHGDGALQGSPTWTFTRQPDSGKTTVYITRGNDVLYEDTKDSHTACPSFNVQSCILT